MSDEYQKKTLQGDLVEIDDIASKLVYGEFACPNFPDQVDHTSCRFYKQVLDKLVKYNVIDK